MTVNPDRADPKDHMVVHRTSRPDHRKLRHLSRVLAFITLTAAAACPALASTLIAFAGGDQGHTQWMNMASMTALLVSPLVALRTSRLRDLLIGPALGLAAGFLDLQTTLWLYESGCSVNTAASVPVWGGILGLWIAAGKERWLNRLVVFSAITMSDSLMRIAWRIIWPRILLSDLDFDGLWDSQWLLEAVVYVPVAVLSVLLASRPQANPSAQ